MLNDTNVWSLLWSEFWYRWPKVWKTEQTYKTILTSDKEIMKSCSTETRTQYQYLVSILGRYQPYFKVRVLVNTSLLRTNTPCSDKQRTADTTWTLQSQHTHQLGGCMESNTAECYSAVAGGGLSSTRRSANATGSDQIIAQSEQWHCRLHTFHRCSIA